MLFVHLFDILYSTIRLQWLHKVIKRTLEAVLMDVFWAFIFNERMSVVFAITNILALGPFQGRLETIRNGPSKKYAFHSNDVLEGKGNMEQHSNFYPHTNKYNTNQYANTHKYKYQSTKWAPVQYTRDISRNRSIKGTSPLNH